MEAQIRTVLCQCWRRVTGRLSRRVSRGSSCRRSWATAWTVIDGEAIQHRCRATGSPCSCPVDSSESCCLASTQMLHLTCVVRVRVVRALADLLPRILVGGGERLCDCVRITSHRSDARHALGALGAHSIIHVRAYVRACVCACMCACVHLQVVAGDPFNSHPSDPDLMGPEAHAAFKAGKPRPTLLARTPLVDLPLDATEDRVCGTIDFERALIEGAD
jgi:hypothetical protein